VLVNCPGPAQEAGNWFKGRYVDGDQVGWPRELVLQLRRRSSMTHVVL
jgi:hypothetical protein